MHRPHTGTGIEAGVAPTNEPEQLPEPLKDLIDDYLNGLLDEAQMAELEKCLRADARARRYFVRYARLHTDLHLEVRARQASQLALDQLAQLAEAGPTPPIAASGTLTFAPGETSKTITIVVNGDKKKHKGSETFFVILDGATNARLDDGLGIGTILDDD
jgi:hypothetical protein